MNNTGSEFSNKKKSGKGNGNTVIDNHERPQNSNNSTSNGTTSSTSKQK